MIYAMTHSHFVRYLLLSVQQKVATQNLMTNKQGDDTIGNLIYGHVIILLAILYQRLIQPRTNFNVGTTFLIYSESSKQKLVYS